MNNVISFQENGANANPNILDNVFRLRHETFINRLGWEIPSCEGRERDQFDDLDPYHIVVTDNDNVKGCWRALPTTSDYMLKDIFPELLQGEAAPQEEDVWEISRFTVDKNKRNEDGGYFSTATIELIKSFHNFAKENNIKSYVTVTTVACERILRQLGVNMRRMGDGKSLQVGVERSVALWIEVDDNLCITKH
ncbi:acyl-homoserine-lactone synthase [Thalassotalea sp. 1_MG-2023]|uniref:acyl-homoserine-lactone synthase n=1 Tax=Thalassotalea sp. 1_MG-2023 TaxID=3062680 RepID=UPI0026E3B1C6|nr:acyl-homoserine-lactone synthase [Thalassotalea sp. 1_MG-2023]MDO6428507.1 acyl-homoserine-lactone synthase [Thalassotalea sp. 1_MG-2023]